MHKFHILGWPSQIFMGQTIFFANAVIFADFAFGHDRSNNMSLPMGPNWVFRAKISLGTLKWTHLLYKKRTFISNSTWPKKEKKSENFTFGHDCTVKISPRMGPNRVFRFKFSLGTLTLTHLLYRKKTFICGQLCRKIQKIGKFRKIHFSLNFSPSCGSYTKKLLKKVVGNWKLHSTDKVSGL